MYLENLLMQYLTCSRFLDSEIINVRASTNETFQSPYKLSPYSFKIHKKLLAFKCKTLMQLYESDPLYSIEGDLSLWEFPAEIVVRFIEWAYTGDYPNRHRGASTGEKHECSSKRSHNGAIKSECATKSIPSTIHLDLYLFSSMHSISELSDLSRIKLCSSLDEMGNSAEGQQQTVYILKRAFEECPKNHSKLKNDPILDTLAQLAACRIDSLRNLHEFRDLLQKETRLFTKVLCAIRPAKRVSWGGESDLSSTED